MLICVDRGRRDEEMTPLPDHADAAFFAPCYHRPPILQSEDRRRLVEGEKTFCHSYNSPVYSQRLSAPVARMGSGSARTFANSQA